MRHPLIEEIEKAYLKSEVPQLRTGDSVSVSVKIKEGNKERIQKFEGVIIALSGTGVAKTFTVRKISSGIGVERIFLVHSPLIENIQVLATKAQIRRSKLYYLRKLQGKKARIKYAITPKNKKKSKAAPKQAQQVQVEENSN